MLLSTGQTNTSTCLCRLFRDHTDGYIAHVRLPPNANSFIAYS